LCEKYLRKKLNKLSETDFVEKLEDETFGDANVHAVAQWELFNRYIEQQNAKKKRS
jgi:hypothetical protein